MSEITTLTNGDQPLAQKVVVEMTSNPLTTFVTLLTNAVDATAPGSGTNSTGTGSTTSNSDTKKSDARKNQDVPIDPNVCR